MIKIYLFIYLISLCSYSRAHFIFNSNETEKTPVISNSNSGFGTFARDDFSADWMLRKNCSLLKVDLKCEVNNSQLGKEIQLLKPTIDELALTNYFRSYVYQSNTIGERFSKKEYNFSNNGCKDNDPKKDNLFTDSQSPHSFDRTSSHEEGIKGVVLNEIFGENGKNQKDHMQRLKLKYPYLYSNKENYDSVVKVLNKYVGKDFKKKSELNEQTFQENLEAIKKEKNSNSSFQTELNQAISKMFEDYGQDLMKSLDQICTMNLDSLIKSYPSSIDQALIDLPFGQREKAHEILCTKNTWYNQKIFDSDCDGINDNKDPSPNDPYSPNKRFHLKGMSNNDPFFGSNYDYTLEKTNTNTLTVSSNFSLQFSSNISDQEIQAQSMKFKECTDKISLKFKSLYKALNSSTYQKWSRFKNELPQNFDFKLNFKFLKSSDKNQPDFKIHRCYCSTCSVFYLNKDLEKEMIPKDTCESDFTTEMKLGINDKKLNPSNHTWFKQEGSRNFTINSECDVITHELLHRFGLPDEYESNNLPFNRRGVDASIMKNSGISKVAILPRHLASIISPSQCLRTQGNHD